MIVLGEIMAIKDLVQVMLERANDNPITPLRLKDWDEIIKSGKLMDRTFTG